MSTPILSFYDSRGRRTVGGKVVGVVDGLYFKKKVNSKKHFLHRPPAICFEVGTLDQAVKLGAERIAIKDQDEKWYIAFIESVRLKGFTFDRGHGKQVALPLWFWKSSVREAEEMLVELKKPAPPPEIVAEQEELFA